jgi:hypothetical protein
VISVIIFFNKLLIRILFLFWLRRPKFQLNGNTNCCLRGREKVGGGDSLSQAGDLNAG